MGLVINRVYFEGVPPKEAEIRHQLEARIGSSYGLDSVTQDGSHIEVRTMMDTLTLPYLLKILNERGGVVVDFETREPRETKLPSFVDTPWRALPLWKRLKIRVLILLGRQ